MDLIVYEVVELEVIHDADGYGVIEGITRTSVIKRYLTVDNLKSFGLHKIMKLLVVINDFLMRLGLIAEPIGWLADKKLAMFATIVSNVWYGIPFFTIMITAALQSVSQDLYEAASVDGANAFVKFRVITIPHIKSVLVLTTLLRVIWIFGNADHIKAMTNGGPAGSTEIITSYMFKVISSDLDYGKAGALGIICMLIMVVYTLVYLRVTKFTSEE